MKLPLIPVVILLAVAVGALVTALDAQTARLTSVVQTAFSERHSDVGTVAFAADWEHLRIVDSGVLFIVLGILFGGLPMGLLAIAADRLRRSPAIVSCYACLALQVVSMILSMIVLTLLLWALSELRAEDLDLVASPDMYFVWYLAVQVAVSACALPAWKRIFKRAADTQAQAYFLRGAA